MPRGRRRVIDRAGLVVVMAKAPRPGAVKTRMTPPLSPEQASELYARLLSDVLDATAAAARACGLEACLAVHPPDACGELSHGAPRAFKVVPQRGAGLAERMAWAVDEAAAGGARRILLRGSDSPTLGRETFERALVALEAREVVLCPDRDGGYNLVGLRRPVAGLFEHPMSTGSVLADTLANAASLGLRTEVLDPGFDLDTIDDLRWLAAARARGDAGMCAKTLAYLDEQNLWRHAPDG